MNPITAERVTSGTYILRWHRGGIGTNRNQVIASARLAGYRYHLPYADQVPEDVADDALHAWRLMLAGLWGDVEAMATHRWAWSWLSLRRELTPIEAVSRG